MKSNKTKRRRVRLSEYFEWSRGEQRGMYVLICLVIVTLIVRCSIPVLFHQPKMIYPEFNDDLMKWITQSDQIEEAIPKNNFSNFTEKKTDKNFGLFHFNPNELEDDEWKKLGLNSGQIKSIRNFLNKGYGFRSKADFKKMYVIDDSTFQRLEPWIDLPEEQQHHNTYQENESDEFNMDENSVLVKESAPKKYSGTIKSDNIIIELNSTDTNALKQLKGIGSWLSNKIIQYRDQLGGFYSIDQLLEVYRMTPEKLEAIRKNFIVDESLIDKRNINKVDDEELKSFPYLNGSQLRAFLAYRSKHGVFQSIEEVKQCVLIDEKTFERIRIYFDVR